MPFVLSGLVTKLKHVPARTFSDGGAAAAHWRAFIAGDEETYQVKLSDDYLAAVGGLMPQKGEDFEAEVSVGAYHDRLSVVAVGPAAALAPAAASVPAPPF